MLFETRSLHLLEEAVNKMQEGFADLPPFEAEVDVDRLRVVMLDLAERLQDNYPYQHPLYAGQMLKPPHSIARLAYMLSLWVNPNNHALDGGRATSALEKEAVANIASMFGFEQHLGHLCGGGTMANLEATYLLLQHAFNLGYRRVEWKCDALNGRSRKAALRMGFKFEGIQESHFIIKGRNRDTAWFRILDSEWPEVEKLLLGLLERNQ